MNRRRLIEWIVFVAPLPLLLMVAFAIPLGSVFYWSFTDPSPGVGNYVRIATDPSFHAIVWRTLRICLISTVVAILIAYLLAYHWVFGPAGRRRFVELAILVPFWISVLVRAFGWLVMLRSEGVINNMLIATGVISEPLALVRNEFGVVVGIVHVMIPFAVFPIAAVMRQIDPRIRSAARGLGAGPVRTFAEIFLPLSMPGVVGAFLIVFVFTLGFFITPSILGGGRVIMVAEYIFIQMQQTANWGLGAAISVTLLLFVSVLIWLLVKLTRVERLVG